MRKNKCPKCGSTNILPIVYGLPTAKLIEKEGITLYLGGCPIEPYKLYCKECEHKFGEKSSLK